MNQPKSDKEKRVPIAYRQFKPGELVAMLAHVRSTKNPKHLTDMEGVLAAHTPDLLTITQAQQIGFENIDEYDSRSPRKPVYVWAQKRLQAAELSIEEAAQLYAALKAGAKHTNLHEYLPSTHPVNKTLVHIENILPSLRFQAQFLILQKTLLQRLDQTKLATFNCTSENLDAALHFDQPTQDIITELCNMIKTKLPEESADVQLQSYLQIRALSNVDANRLSGLTDQVKNDSELNTNILKAINTLQAALGTSIDLKASSLHDLYNAFSNNGFHGTSAADSIQSLRRKIGTLYSYTADSIDLQIAAELYHNPNVFTETSAVKRRVDTSKKSTRSKVLKVLVALAATIGIPAAVLTTIRPSTDTIVDTDANNGKTSDMNTTEIIATDTQVDAGSTQETDLPRSDGKSEVSLAKAVQDAGNDIDTVISEMNAIEQATVSEPTPSIPVLPITPVIDVHLTAKPVRLARAHATVASPRVEPNYSENAPEFQPTIALEHVSLGVKHQVNDSLLSLPNDTFEMKRSSRAPMPAPEEIEMPTTTSESTKNPTNADMTAEDKAALDKAARIKALRDRIRNKK